MRITLCTVFYQVPGSNCNTVQQYYVRREKMCHLGNGLVVSTPLWWRVRFLPSPPVFCHLVSKGSGGVRLTKRQVPLYRTDE